MDKRQRQDHRVWVEIPEALRVAWRPFDRWWGFYVDRDPGDEHDQDGAIAYRDSIAAINVGRVRRGEHPIKVPGGQP